MSDERPPDDRGDPYDRYPSEPEPDDLEVLLFEGAGPELTSEQAERNTELLVALAVAARDSGVVPTFLQLPAAPPDGPASYPARGGPTDHGFGGADGVAAADGSRGAGGIGAAGGSRGTGGVGGAGLEGAYCLRMGVQTRVGVPLGRIDFLNAVLRLARAYQLGMSVGESIGGSAGDSAGVGGLARYQLVLPYRSSAPGPDARPDCPRRPDPLPRARHRVIDLTARVPVPPGGPLNGSLMVTVVGPVDGGLAADLARIAVFLDDHRVGCHAASASKLARTLVLNLVLAVLPNAPVDTEAFAEILRSGLASDPVWPTRFRPTLLDPVATR